MLLNNIHVIGVKMRVILIFGKHMAIGRRVYCLLSWLFSCNVIFLLLR